LDFDFNPEIPTRKHFGFWKMGNPISGNRFYPEKYQPKQFGLVRKATLWPKTPMHTLIGSLPKHQYVWVDSSFTHKDTIGFVPVPAVWFGLVSHPGRMWGCNVMLESGAVYRGLPLHALAHDRYPTHEWREWDAQMWDCYGYDWSATEYTFLRSLRCKTRQEDCILEGEYLFTVAPIGDGFSEAPEQSKEFMFIKLTNGRFTVKPTDQIVFEDRSFTQRSQEWPTGLKRMDEIFSCE